MTVSKRPFAATRMTASSVRAELFLDGPSSGDSCHLSGQTDRGLSPFPGRCQRQPRRPLYYLCRDELNLSPPEGFILEYMVAEEEY